MAAEKVTEFFDLHKSYVTDLEKDVFNPELHLYEAYRGRGFNLTFQESSVRRNGNKVLNVFCPDSLQYFSLSMRTEITQKLPDFQYLLTASRGFYQLLEKAGEGDLDVLGSHIVGAEYLKLSQEDQRSSLALAYLRHEDNRQREIACIRGIVTPDMYDSQYEGEDPEAEIDRKLLILNDLRLKRETLGVEPMSRQRMADIVGGLVDRTEKFIRGD